MVSLIAVAYLGLLAFPDPLFAHSMVHGPFRVLSDAPIDPGLIQILDQASAKLERSPYNDPSMIHRIYLCNGSTLRRILTPMTASAFGSTFSGMSRRNTFLNRVDIPANSISSGAERWNRRPLDSVIAHERTHALLGSHFGDIRAWFLPEWKVEGYCEAIGGNPSFDRSEGKRLIRERGSDASPAFRYFRYGLMVRYLVEIEGVGPESLMSGTFDPAALQEKVRDNLDRL